MCNLLPWIIDIWGCSCVGVSMPNTCIDAERLIFYQSLKFVWTANSDIERQEMYNIQQPLHTLNGTSVE